MCQYQQSWVTGITSSGIAIVAIAVALALGGCTEESRENQGGMSEEEDTNARHTTVVFVDPTTMERDGEVRDMVVDSLRRIANRKLRTRGDKVVAFQIRRRTEVKTPQVSIENQIDPADNRQFVDQRAMQEAVIQNQTRTLIAEAESTLTKFLTEVKANKNEAPGAPSSDLLGAMEVIREETEGGEAQAVYFFSDMFHSVPEGRRNFEQSPPGSREEAAEWAQTDADMLQKRLGLAGGNPDSGRSGDRSQLLEETTIRMLPGPAAARRASSRIEAYWRTLFAELGAEASDITYN
jgi:hypothetical protein